MIDLLVLDLLFYLENSMAVVHQLKKADFVFHLDHLVMMSGYQIQISVLDMNQSDFT